MDIGTILALVMAGMSMFGKKPTPESQQTTQETTTETPRMGYQSPLTGMMDMGMAETLLKGLGAYGNWGGQNIASPWIQKMLDALGTQWPDVLQNATTPGRNPNAIPGPKTKLPLLGA